MKFIIRITSIVISTFLFSNTFALNYCAGIRGNGELAPAHWAAMARIVESAGLPEKAAGGSSAAITMMFLDALSRNENLSASPQTKNAELALLLKSLVPHIMYLYKVDAKSPKIMNLVGNITGIGDSGLIGKLKKAVKVAKDLPAFFNVMGEYGKLLNPEFAKGLHENFSFYKSQIAEGASALGAFDAQNDMNLFYREGVIDFKVFAIFLGRIGDFYAGYGNQSTNEKIGDFLKSCRADSVGKLWSVLIHERPDCAQLFDSALDSYYQERDFPNKIIFEKVGSGLNVFPTTSLIIKDGEKKYTDMLKSYIKKEAKGVQDFNVDFDRDLKYGYWGKTSELMKIKNALKSDYPKDTKSSKFSALLEGTWFEVISTSPAEPGLSNLLRIPDSTSLEKEKVLKKRYFKKFLKLFPTLRAISWINEENPKKGIIPFRKGIYSAGGWSDLHPNIVLKASGCDHVLYVTRQGGESVFGQQIFIRLTGYTDKISFWRDIKAKNGVGRKDLSAVEKNSPWNKLYNLANPSSSFNRSLEVADGVYCTDWDKFYIFEGEVEQTLVDAYSSPLFLKDEALRSALNFGKDSSNRSKDNFPGCIIKE